MISLVDSVQHIAHTFQGTDTQTYATLASGTNVDNCVPFISWYGNIDYPDGQFFDVWFEDTGNDPRIYFERTNDRSTSLYVSAEIVEFDPTKVRVYQGLLPTSIGTSETKGTTVSGGFYNQTHSALKFYYRTDSSSQALGYHMCRGQLPTTSGTYGDAPTFYRYQSTNATYGHYFIFESLNDDFKVYHWSGTFAANTTIYPKGAAYDANNSFLLTSNCLQSSNAGASYSTLRAYLWNGAGIPINRSSTSYTTSYNTQLVEFDNEATASGVWYAPKITMYHSLGTTTTERTISFDDWSMPSSTATIFPVQNPTRCSSTGTAAIDAAFVGMWLTNSGTQYTTKRASTSSSSTYPTYNCVDWAGIPPQYPDLGTNPSPIDPLTSPVKSVENGSGPVKEHWQPQILTKGQDVSNCIVFETGFCDDQTSSYDKQYVNESLTYFRGNELIIDRGNEGYNYNSEFSVVEFYPDQVKVQQGFFTIEYNQTITTVTIDSIDTAKTFMVFGHHFDDSTNAWNVHMVRGRITDSTTLTFSRGASHNGPIMGSFYIAEDLGDNWTVRHWNSSSSNATVYALEWDDYYSPYNSFSLTCSETDSANSAPSYSTWRTYFHSWMAPMRAERTSGSYNCTISAQMIKFTDVSKLRVQHATKTISTTQEVVTQNLYEEWEGYTDLTMIFNNGNRLYRSSSTSNSTNIATFARIKYLPETNQFEWHRNYGSTSHSSYGTVFIVDWVGQEKSTGDFDYNNLGYFIKSMERFTYAGANRRTSFSVSKSQDLNNCVPIATWSLGEDDGDDPDRLHYMFHMLPDIGKVLFEAYWGGNNPGTDLDMTLLEFDPLQVRVQYGIEKLMDGTQTQLTTISGVDTSKAFIIPYFIVSDNVGGNYGGSVASARFNSSTELEFHRGLTNGNLGISWFVVECLQDQWTVDHSEINNSNVTYYDHNFATSTPLNKTISVASYAHDQTNVYPSYVMFRMYPSYNQLGVYRIRVNRQATSAQIERMNVSRIAFNDNLAVNVTPIHFYFGTTVNSITADIGHACDVNSTVVMNGTISNTMRTNTTSTTSGPQRGFFKAVLEDSNTLRITRAEDTYAVEAWGHVYVTEFDLPTHEVSGIVREKGSFAERGLNLHSTTTGDLLGSVTSSGTDGTYSVVTSYSGSTYLVCFDDEAGTVYNGLIETNIYPIAVPDTYPYEEGWI